MIKEKNPLIDLKLSKKESNFNKLYKTSSETFYLLFDLILEDPIENIWFELINILSGYLQLLMYLLDPTVSIYIIKLYYSFIQFGIINHLKKNMEFLEWLI